MASSLEGNKYAAAVLTAAIVGVGSGVVGGLLYSPHEAEELAYEVDMSTIEGEQTADAEPQEEISLASLLAEADPAAGEGAVRACQACHSFDEGGGNKVGPALYGVVGREIAGVGDFSYSGTLSGMDGVWDYEALNGFLVAPNDWAPGTSMSYAGVKKDGERADIIVYLQSISPDAPPLPEPDEGGEQAAEAAPEDGGAAEEETAAAADQEQTTEGETDTADAGDTASGAETADQSQEQADAGDDQSDTEQTEPQQADQGSDAGAEQDQETQQAAASQDDVGGEQPAADADTSESASGGTQLASVFAEADPEEGQKVARRCRACHTFDEGGGNRVGPGLHGVVGRAIASVDGFSYSDALSGKDGAWDYETLFNYLEAPMEWAPGTSMNFAGIGDPADRGDLIAYLRSVSPEAPPLPGE
ncbi:MAG: c-type cytochrome [Geminicoccaceae bacterium]